MKTIDLYLFLTSYTWFVAIAFVAKSLRRPRTKQVVSAIIAVGLLVGNTIVGQYVDPDRGYIDVLHYLINERDVSSLVALFMGIAAAYGWIARLWRPVDPSPSLHSASRFRSLAWVMAPVCVVACGHAFIWKDVSGVTRHAVSVASSEFEIEKIADLDDQPLRIATDEDGTVYVCFDYFKKHGAWGGAVLRFRLNSESGEYEKKTIVESPLLARCYGLLVRDGSLYVSRSGFFPEAQMGQVTYEATGAITELRDLDGDGYFEYANDIVTGLPGVRAPDTMQQNNGMTFAEDGGLYVTNASAADRTLDDHPWGGAILRYNPDWTGPEVVARGFRNPWTITSGPDGSLFVTDSDVDKNPGDEINHVIAGEHYGHPFVIPNERNVEAVGFREPILVGERESVFLGLVYATSPNLPEAHRNCLYVTDFRLNRVLQLRLEQSGDTYRVTDVEPFAQIPSPVDMAITPEGDIFVISRRAKKLYRIRPKGT